MATRESFDLVFYDGSCGLCHRLVSFVLARDPDGSRFRYAPLGGPTFVHSFVAGERERLPDSVVVRTADGRTLVRSAAVIQLGERLGGGWRGAARAASFFPHWLLDLAYDGIAGIRRALFVRPETTCPIVPLELRGRFLP